MISSCNDQLLIIQLLALTFLSLLVLMLVFSSVAQRNCQNNFIVTVTNTAVALILPEQDSFITRRTFKENNSRTLIMIDVASLL